MAFIILVLLVAVVLGFLVGSLILLWISKLFRINFPSYKKSIVVLIVLSVVGSIAGLVSSMINLGFLTNALAALIVFFTFHYLYKRYYQSSWGKSLGIYIVFTIIGILISVVIIVPVRLYVVQPFVVSGEAMSPAYVNGDYILINEFDKQFDRGDVIILNPESSPNISIIKRVVGLPLDKVEIRDGKVLINGQTLNEAYSDGDTAGDISVTLGGDQYFVLGDNRNKSLDSRSFGPVSKSNIQGKVFYKISGLLKYTF